MEGGATGEEAYSIAMIFRELMDTAPHQFRVQIYSTDIDEEAIAVARAGAYPPNIAIDLTPERLRRFFVRGRDRIPDQERDPGDGESLPCTT